MSFANISLEGYLIKCGAPDYEAKIVASLFGESYTALNTMNRSNGAGSNSKAHAAISICEGVFVDNSQPGLNLFNEIKNVEDIKKALKVIRSAGICSVAVSAYAFQINDSVRVLKDYASVLKYARNNSIKSGIKEFPDPIMSEFKVELERTIIGSLALGKRKGFFSKLLG